MIRALFLALGLGALLYYISTFSPLLTNQLSQVPQKPLGFDLSHSLTNLGGGHFGHPPAPGSEKRPLRLGDLNFLHTTDTHAWLGGHLNQRAYDANWGDFVSFVARMQERAQRAKKDLVVVDSGDRHDGNGLGDATSPNGRLTTPIFARMQYDILTLGNHELYLWENSQQEIDVLVPHYGEKYVCSNVEYVAKNGSLVPFARRFRYFTTPHQKLRVLAFAFLFDFNRANSRTRVTSIEHAITQKWFKDVLKEYPASEVDAVVVVGHIPVSKQWTELQLLHATLRSAYPNTVIQYFGGHSHIRDFRVYDKLSTGLQSGRFCETAGFVSINFSPEMSVKDRFFRSYIDFSVDSFLFHSQKESFAELETAEGAEVKQMLTSAREELQLDTVLGHVNTNYFMDYVPLTHPKNIYSMLTERVLPTLERNKSSAPDSERIIIINTGSVRYDLYKGPYTIDSHYIVSPFQNDWVKITVPKEIAIKIAPKLNENDYIVAGHEGTPGTTNAWLKPPHQRYLDQESGSTVVPRQIPISYPDLHGEVDLQGRLSKGYVTYDDFGHSGDDTPHRGVKNYPMPNVVQSLDLKPGLEGSVDVVFYSFLIPNVVEAVRVLGGEHQEPEFYSAKYLGLLLDEYVGANEV